MGRKKLFTVISVICIMALVVSFGLSGCGKKAGTGGQDAGGDNIIKIASVSPLSGPQAAFGDSVRMGVEMAIEENKAEMEKAGFKVEFTPQDDQGDPKMGVAIAQKLVTDPNVLAVAGHMNSGVTIPASEVYAKANLAMYTPIATNPQITDRGLKNVGRVCGRDDVQGASAAQFAFDTLKSKSAFIVHDKTAYGQGIAEEFKKKAEALGMKVLGFDGVTPGEVDFSAVVNKIVQAKPDVVYHGGTYTEGGLILKQMREKGSKAQYIGCDGDDSSEMVKIAGKYVVGSYYTSMASDVGRTPEGKDWMARFEKKFSKQPEAYATYSYDAGLAIMKGIQQAITDNGGKKPTRDQIVEAMRKVEAKGVTAQITFNENGDNSNAKSFVLQFTAEKYPGDVVAEINLNK